MNVRVLRVAVLISAAVALAGCAALSGLDRPPRVNLVTLKPVELQLLEQRYLATLRIQNPNDVALPVHGLDYEISINGESFAQGVSDNAVSIPAFGEATLEVPVNSTIVKLFEQLRHFADNEGVLRYSISGTLGITGIPGGIPFSQSGEIDLAPRRAPEGRTVQRAARMLG